VSVEKAVLDVRRLGRTRYEDAHKLQVELVEARIDHKIRDTLLLTEHEAVVTLGRGSSRDEVAAVTVPVVEVERGGDATYHGPGQVIAYPILELSEARRDLHRYMRDLEEVVIRVLAEFDVKGHRENGLTGVWIGDKKVCSIGVAVRRWVAWHGFALNVFTDLEAFKSFKPCGLKPETMTRLVDHAELPPANILIEVLIIKHFCDVFGFDLPPPAPRPVDRDPRYPELPILPS
jgi:lipoyl(octanoyl) transferase